jgi:hypothetical protein
MRPRNFHQAVYDTLAIVERELGVAAAHDVFADAVLRAAENQHSARTAAGVRTVAARRGEDEAIVAALWDQLGERCPGAFAIAPALLTPFSDPITLAYLYALKNEIGETLHEFAPLHEERALIESGRGLLAEWTGLGGFRSAAESYVFRGDSALSALMQFRKLDGCSFSEEWLLVRDVLLSGGRINAERRRGQEGTVEIAALVLHEEIHSAISCAVQGSKNTGDDLCAAIDEAATTLLALLAIVYLTTGKVRKRDLRRYAGWHGYRRQTLALLDLLPGRIEPAETARELATLVIQVSKTDLSSDAARALNRVAGDERTPIAWLTRFSPV